MQSVVRFMIAVKALMRFILRAPRPMAERISAAASLLPDSVLASVCAVAAGPRVPSAALRSPTPRTPTRFLERAFTAVSRPRLWRDAISHNFRIHAFRVSALQIMGASWISYGVRSGFGLGYTRV